MPINKRTLTSMIEGSFQGIILFQRNSRIYRNLSIRLREVKETKICWKLKGSKERKNNLNRGHHWKVQSKVNLMNQKISMKKSLLKSLKDARLKNKPKEIILYTSLPYNMNSFKVISVILNIFYKILKAFLSKMMKFLMHLTQLRKY